MGASGGRKRVAMAAGTVALRFRDAGEPEVLLVHRPRYDDWSLPKGKLAAGEYPAACAVRETGEESGLLVRLGPPLDQVEYAVAGGRKQVRYWRADVVANDGFTPSAEVDKARWLPVSKAVVKASYPEEPALIRQAVALPASTPLIIVRHAKALARDAWAGPDSARPLDERGRRQSNALTALLGAYGVRRLVSSSSTRCLRTLTPYGRDPQVRVEHSDALTEQAADAAPEEVAALMRRLAAQTATGTPTAVCGHRPVLPVMLEALGVADRRMRPGEAVVAHLGPEGGLLAIETCKSPV